LEFAARKNRQCCWQHVRERSAARDVETRRASILEEFMEGITACGDVDLPPDAEICDRRGDSFPQDIIRDEFCNLTIQ